jgi:hypothetical protein
MIGINILYTRSGLFSFIRLISMHGWFEGMHTWNKKICGLPEFLHIIGLLYSM